MKLTLKEQHMAVEEDVATVLAWAHRTKFTGILQIPMNHGGAVTPLVLIDKKPNGHPHAGKTTYLRRSPDRTNGHSS